MFLERHLVGPKRWRSLSHTNTNQATISFVRSEGTEPSSRCDRRLSKCTIHYFYLFYRLNFSQAHPQGRTNCRLVPNNQKIIQDDASMTVYTSRPKKTHDGFKRPETAILLAWMLFQPKWYKNVLSREAHWIKSTWNNDYTCQICQRSSDRRGKCNKRYPCQNFPTKCIFTRPQQALLRNLFKFGSVLMVENNDNNFAESDNGWHVKDCDEEKACCFDNEAFWKGNCICTCVFVSVFFFVFVFELWRGSHTAFG